MKKYVVLSVNENPKYLYYLPFVRWAWNQFGCDSIVFTTQKVNVEILKPPQCVSFTKLQEINGYKSETIAQVSRLYATCIVDNGSDYLMTSDVDMLPLSNYHFEILNAPKKDYIKDGSGRYDMKQFVSTKPTSFGRDLTDYHYPICYIGMSAANWYGVMDLCNMDYNNMIKRDLVRVYPKSKNKWCVDQDLITENLLEYGKDKITHIDRGTDKRTGYPIGRVDRSNWHLNHSQLIDAHLPHDILSNDASYKKVCDLLKHVWPSEDFTWYHNYHNEFKKLL